MSTLRIFLPANERIPADAPLDWVLLDRRTVARDGRSTVAEMPRADEIEAILPAARVLFARLKLPRVSDSTIRELLPFAVEDRLLADPGHIHAVAGQTDAAGDTAVAVVDREWLGAIIRMLGGAGRMARHAWCESALLPATANDWHVVLRAQSGVLVDRAGVASTFDWHAGGSLPLAIRIALDEASTRNERPQRVIVHDDRVEAGALPDLAGWGAEAGVALEQAAPWQELRTAAPAPSAIDLLAGDFGPRRRGAGALRLSRAAAGIALAIILVQLAFTGVDTWRLQRERSQLDARREAIFRSAFPEARVVVDPELQMSRNLAQLRAAHGLASGDDFLTGLTAAARESPAPATTVDYAKGRLTVQRAAQKGGR